jgi:hypothetical protein
VALSRAISGARPTNSWPDGVSVGGGWLRPAEGAFDLVAAGTAERIGIQKSHHQGVQLFRDVADQAPGRSDVALLLVGQHLVWRIRKRQAPGQRFVKQDAHAVPVGRRLQRQAPDLFGRHVGQRSGQLAATTFLVAT